MNWLDWRSFWYVNNDRRLKLEIKTVILVSNMIFEKFSYDNIFIFFSFLENFWKLRIRKTSRFTNNEILRQSLTFECFSQEIFSQNFSKVRVISWRLDENWDGCIASISRLFINSRSPKFIWFFEKRCWNSIPGDFLCPFWLILKFCFKAVSYQ